MLLFTTPVTGRRDVLFLVSTEIAYSTLKSKYLGLNPIKLKGCVSIHYLITFNYPYTCLDGIDSNMKTMHCINEKKKHLKAVTVHA